MLSLSRRATFRVFGILEDSLSHVRIWIRPGHIYIQHLSTPGLFWPTYIRFNKLEICSYSTHGRFGRSPCSKTPIVSPTCFSHPAYIKQNSLITRLPNVHPLKGCGSHTHGLCALVLEKKLHVFLSKSSHAAEYPRMPFILLSNFVSCMGIVRARV